MRQPVILRGVTRTPHEGDGPDVFRLGLRPALAVGRTLVALTLVMRPVVTIAGVGRPLPAAVLRPAGIVPWCVRVAVRSRPLHGPRIGAAIR